MSNLAGCSFGPRLPPERRLPLGREPREKVVPQCKAVPVRVMPNRTSKTLDDTLVTKIQANWRRKLAERHVFLVRIVYEHARKMREERLATAHALTPTDQPPRKEELKAIVREDVLGSVRRVHNAYKAVAMMKQKVDHSARVSRISTKVSTIGRMHLLRKSLIENESTWNDLFASVSQVDVAEDTGSSPEMKLAVLKIQEAWRLHRKSKRSVSPEQEEPAEQEVGGPDDLERLDKFAARDRAADSAILKASEVAVAVVVKQIGDRRYASKSSSCRQTSKGSAVSVGSVREANSSHQRRPKPDLVRHSRRSRRSSELQVPGKDGLVADVSIPGQFRSGRQTPRESSSTAVRLLPIHSETSTLTSSSDAAVCRRQDEISSASSRLPAPCGHGPVRSDTLESMPPAVAQSWQRALAPPQGDPHLARPKGSAPCVFRSVSEHRERSPAVPSARLPAISARPNLRPL